MALDLNQIKCNLTNDGAHFLGDYSGYTELNMKPVLKMAQLAADTIMRDDDIYVIVCWHPDMPDNLMLAVPSWLE
jgi:hypothetical protein